MSSQYVEIAHHALTQRDGNGGLIPSLLKDLQCLACLSFCIGVFNLQWKSRDHDNFAADRPSTDPPHLVISSTNLLAEEPPLHTILTFIMSDVAALEAEVKEFQLQVGSVLHLAMARVSSRPSVGDNSV